MGKKRDFKREAFRQLKGKVPERVKQTERTKGPEKARKQRIAIALDLARELEKNNN